MLDVEGNREIAGDDERHGRGLVGNRHPQRLHRNQGAVETAQRHPLPALLSGGAVRQLGHEFAEPTAQKVLRRTGAQHAHAGRVDRENRVAVQSDDEIRRRRQHG
jgi:hypothetical protein